MAYFFQKEILKLLKNSIPIKSYFKEFSAECQQGQTVSKDVREYFYFIDHQGQLFLEGTKIKNFVTCFKDSEFLMFFFKRLRINNTGKYIENFPYISRCGPEMNYVRCENRPVVYTGIIEKDHSYQLILNGIGDKMTFTFDPSGLCMFPKNGRVYHPASKRVGGAGILKTSLAIDLSSNFLFLDGNSDYHPPTHFQWSGKTYELHNRLWEVLRSENVEDG